MSSVDFFMTSNEKKEPVEDYYHGSEEIYDGEQRTSQYLTMKDGTKLAIDIYRPTKEGKLHEEPLPVIWCATQYRRSRLNADGSLPTLNEISNLWFTPGIDRVLRHGYVVAALDCRGSGASFGHHGAQVGIEDYWDFYDVNEWLASQPYCNGVTGMFGLSFLGKTQWSTAMMAPPSLKCIMPCVSSFDTPYLNNNGVCNIGWTLKVGDTVSNMSLEDLAAPVDEDTDRAMLMAAIEEHKKNPLRSVERSYPYLDDYNPYSNRKTYLEIYPPLYFWILNSAKIACYVVAALRDFGTTDSFDWFSSIRTPKKLVCGPWIHTGCKDCVGAPWDFITEHIRWYDYWLKGINNGIMDEPQVMIYNDGAEEWRTYESYPIPGVQRTNFYLSGEASGTINSVKDGSLARKKPVIPYDATEYTVRYDTTKRGFFDRNWYDTPGNEDYTEFDRKGLTFTTVEFEEDVSITGAPILYLWMSADVKDIDFYAYLEDIAPDGTSKNITEGRIRASFRATMEPPYNRCGSPFHRQMHRDQEDLPINEPVRLDFDLLVMSRTLLEGHRLRLTLTNADKLNFDTPELDPAPHVTIYHGKERASYISLPIDRKVCC